VSWTTITASKAAAIYSERYVPVRVPPVGGRPTKGPRETGWAKRRPRPEDFADSDNVGLLLGASSHGLTDVDLDCIEAIFMAPLLLPSTGMQSGRPSKPRSHLWYEVPDPQPTKQFQFKGEMLVELRCGNDSHQTLVPPSVHPSGEVLRWYDDEDPAAVRYDALLTAVERLAAAALLSRHWPRSLQHNAGLALSGGLARAGWSEDQIADFATAISACVNREETDRSKYPADGDPDKRRRLARTSIEKNSRGERVTGIPSLVKYGVPTEVAHKAFEWLHVGPPAEQGAFPRLPPSIARAAEGTETGEPQVEEASGWPDPRPVGGKLLPVPAFDPALLPDDLRGFVVDVAERMQCPIDFPAAAAMVALGAVVGRRRTIHPKRRDDWAVVPNLWGAVVAPPSSMKTPPVKEVIGIVRAIEEKAREKHLEAVQDHEFKAELAKKREKQIWTTIERRLKDHGAGIEKIGPEPNLDDLQKALAATKIPDPPQPPRYVVNDTTIEMLIELFRHNPNGLLMFRDELLAWLRSFEREGREGDRAAYLELWDGTGSFTVDRIGRGTLMAKATPLGVFGCLQPGPLQDYFRGSLGAGSGDDGLVQRFQMLVYPDLSPEWKHVDRYPDMPARHRAEELFRRMAALEPLGFGSTSLGFGSTSLRFAEDAQYCFDEWLTTLERGLRTSEDNPAMIGHLAKYRSLMPSLALICHLASGPGAESKPVSLWATQQAIGWCTYLEEHARRIYGLAQNAPESAAQRILELIRKGKIGDGFDARSLKRRQLSGLDGDAVDSGLAVLEEFGWVRAEEIKTGGRPTTKFRVHPSTSASEPDTRATT
jgi:hypothetical protein